MSRECPECHSDNPANSPYCTTCGYEFVRPAPAGPAPFDAPAPPQRGGGERYGDPAPPSYYGGSPPPQPAAGPPPRQPEASYAQPDTRYAQPDTSYAQPQPEAAYAPPRPGVTYAYPRPDSYAPDSRPIMPDPGLAFLSGARPACLAYNEATLANRAAYRSIPMSVVILVLIAAAAFKFPAILAAFPAQTIIVPIAIVCAFCWGNRFVALRSARIKALERGANEDTLRDILRAVGVARTADDLVKTFSMDDAQSRSPLVRHTLSLARQWAVKSEIQDADVVLQQEVDKDDERVHSGFQLPRMLVWAMPVMGLIGTVIGISLATGGFATFLKGNVDDVAAIKSSLVGVTSGLSFAFLITLLGLLGALVLMFHSSFAQAREEKMFANVHAWIANSVLPAIQSKWPPSAEMTTAGGPVNTDAFERFAKSIGDEIANGVKAAMSWSAERQLEFARTMKETTEAHARALVDAKNAYEQLAGTTANVLSAQQTIAGAAGALSASLNDVNAKLPEMIAGIGVAGGAATEVANTVQGFGAFHNAIQDSVRQLGASIGDLNSGIPAMVNVIREASAATSELGSTTRTILGAQSQMNDSVRQLHEMSLTPALVDLAASLARLQPVLSALTRPFVLRPMELDGAGGAAGVVVSHG